MFSDLKFAFRQLTKAPGFTAIAVLTLALGIGANTAIFSVVQALMLRPLPYDHADELVVLYENNPSRHIDKFAISGPKYLEWQKRNDVFQEMGALYVETQSLTGAGTPIPVCVGQITSSYLQVWRFRPQLGRLFTKDEDRADMHDVAILTHSLWQRQFGGAADVVGKTIRIAGKPHTVIGVLAAGGMRCLDGSEMIFIPLATEKIQDGPDLHYYQVAARLKVGVTIANSQAALSTLTDTLNKENRNFGDWGVLVQSVRSDLLGSWPEEKSILLLQGAVFLLLLITSANTANLLLARASSRKKEIAIRLALGCTRWQLIRQLLVESTLLALLGGLAGVFLASLGIEIANTWLKSQEIIIWSDVKIEPAVLAFSLVVSVGTGIFFGLIPAWQTTKPDVQSTLKGTSQHATAGTPQRRMLDVLVMGEIALALLLLIGAGLFVRNLNQLLKTSPGFDSTNVLVTQSSLDANRYATDAQRNQFVTAALDQLKAIPGVKDAAAIDVVPMTGGSSWGTYIVGRPRNESSSFLSAQTRRISPNYFQTLKVALRQGRIFTDADHAKAPAVVVINETFARQYFPGTSPIGQLLEVYDGTVNPKTIVGVVADERVFGLTQNVPLTIYVPTAQGWFKGAMTSYSLNFVIRTERDPLPFAKTVQSQLRTLDPDLAFASTRPISWFVTYSIAMEISLSGLLTAFSVTALFLAALGIYGIMANSVNQRTNEFGIRLALGATPKGILLLVFKRGMILLTTGVVAGLVGSFIGTRYLRALLHDVSPTDPLVITIVILFLALAAALACWLPARRATRVNPIEALRAE